MRGFREAVSFLTRIPADRRSTSAADLGSTIPWFPLVGALVGALIGLAFAGARLLLPSPVAATLAVAVGIFLTGGLHEDGLADTADALGGGRDRQDALRIMKDPGHGTYGVLATTLGLILRIGAVGALAPGEAIAALVCAHALSRATAGALVVSVRPAVDSGLGAAYVAATRLDQAVAGVVVALLISGGLLGAWMAPAAGFAALAAAGLGWISVRKLGGVTGDILGAAQQVAEIAVLLVAAAVVSEGWGPIPWWRG